MGLRQRQRRREELLEKLAEKHLLKGKQGRMKALEEHDPRLDDRAAWVERRGRLQKELGAEQRARLLEEMDRVFGVSALVEAEFGRRRQGRCSPRDWQGLTVERAMDSFREGEPVTLTLQDKGMLREGEHAPENVNLVGKEQAEKNVELRRKEPDCLPCAEVQSVDDLARQKLGSLLSKDDEELEGERPHSFRLEQGGVADGLRDWELEEIRAKLQAQSLSSVGPRLASEYLTPEETMTFQRKKWRGEKVHKKEGVVLPLGDQTQYGDFGFRLWGQSGRRLPEEEDKEPVPQSLPSDDFRVENMDISDEEDGAPPSGSPKMQEEVELGLQKQLAKGPGLWQWQQLQQLQDGGGKVVELVKRAGRRKKTPVAGGHRVQRLLRALPHPGGDPHLRTGWKPGGAHGL